MSGNQNNVYYVYQYITPDGLPYYIGKGKGRRVHMKHSVTLPPKEYRQILHTGLTNEEAKKLEIELIQKYKRKVDGGILDNIKINQWACFDGWNHTDETKQKISNSLTGRTLSEETKEKMRKPKSAAHAQKIRDANIGRKDDGRYVKIGKTKSEQRWFNNGINSIMVIPGQEPTGYSPGRIYVRKSKQV